MDFGEGLMQELEEEDPEYAPSSSRTRTKAASSVVPDIATVPSNKKDQRACLVCGLVKAGILLYLNLILQTTMQFLESGCDNCEPYLELRGNQQAIEECTTASFFGLACFSWLS